jgi:hypothetical protein
MSTERVMTKTGVLSVDGDGALQHAAPVKPWASLIQENKVKPLRLQRASGLLIGRANANLVTKCLEICTTRGQIAEFFTHDNKPAPLNGLLFVRDWTICDV